MPPIEERVMREQFEKVADEQLGVVGALIGLERDGEGYKAEAVNGAWTIWKRAWQAAVAAERERAVNAIKAKAEAIKFGEFRHPCNKAVINALESVASAIRDGGKHGE